METTEQTALAILATALSKAQATMSGAVKNKVNPFYKSSYNDLSSAFDAIKGPFAENGLSISQPIIIIEGRQVLRTLLMHSGGGHIESQMLLPEIDDPQKLGKAITYYRRYALMSIAGLPAEDDDGNTASKAVAEQRTAPKYITAAQVKLLETALSARPDLRAEIVARLEDNRLDRLEANRFDGCLNHINKELGNG